MVCFSIVCFLCFIFFFNWLLMCFLPCACKMHIIKVIFSNSISKCYANQFFFFLKCFDYMHTRHINKEFKANYNEKENREFHRNVNRTSFRVKATHTHTEKSQCKKNVFFSFFFSFWQLENVIKLHKQVTERNPSERKDGKQFVLSLRF